MTCSMCGAALVPIAYGYPAPEVIAASERGEVLIGGCTIDDDRPRFGCVPCWAARDIFG